MQQLIEAARIASTSIWAHKLRSFLTLLGVIIGVSVVIAVATLIEGANVYVDDRFRGRRQHSLFEHAGLAARMNPDDRRAVVVRLGDASPALKIAAPRDTGASRPRT